MPDWLREIDHTADVGIVVTAPDRDTLYARAAVGTFRLLTDVEAVRETAQETVIVEAGDAEALMVRWLSELNFLHTTRHVLFRRFDVAVSDTQNGLRLEATCHGEDIDRDRHPIYTEIKAVTFHDMQIRETDGTWEVQVIYDL